MSPKLQHYDFANQLLASQDFFDRSTRVLDEADSGFRPREGMMTGRAAGRAHSPDSRLVHRGITRPGGFDLDFEKHASTLAAVTSLAAARQMLESAYANSANSCARAARRISHNRSRPAPSWAANHQRHRMGMVEHTAHHRGALTVYSRLLGKVPRCRTAAKMPNLDIRRPRLTV